MRLSQTVVVASALSLLATAIAVMTLFLSPVARWVPAIVILPTLTLLLFALLRELASAHPRSDGARNADAPLNARSEPTVIAAVLLMPVLVHALGLVAAVFAFTYGYVRRRASGSEVHGLLAGTAVGLLVYGLGGVVLGNRVLEGWLWMQLGLQS
jgi:hypothetical protein